jgi:phosphatidylglycerophosphatase A
MIKKFNLLFVTFFNIGRIKYAQGTFASFFTCIFFLLSINILNIITLFFFTLFIFIYSIIAINNVLESFDAQDPKEIVVDEVVGQMLPLLAIPIYENFYPTSMEYYCIAAFLFFRLFDIWKPFPVNYVDKNIKGGLGIMLDDILSGIYVIIILTFSLFVLGS